MCIYAFPDGPVFAGEGSPVQQLKAFAFVEALSRELGRPINLDDIDDLNIS